ncbi:MAG TPA: M14 metallopeptidase family protein [Blastocatellia bacterium]|nr:M14 metallopeptidase family protein [Blastocatellia bacterium]
MRKPRLHLASVVVVVSLLASAATFAQTRITTPKEQLGFNFGDDYQLANYVQLVDYWKKLDQQSDRMSLVEIGKTAEGRMMLMAIITAPENHKKLDRYREIARQLATAEGLTDEQAHALAAEGKAVVWIDGGLHATEVLGAQQLMELVYQMVSMNDTETNRILKDVILLATCVNPDGLDLVSNWYMREQDPLKRSTAGLPRLYQKYIGHDNNRDFYMVNQPETEAINRVFFHDWFPQIVYNHHQTGPVGTVLFAPPFRDPFNYYLDPLVPLGIDLVGAAMHSRFVAEDKPGATMRSGSSYSTWWNGGLRTVTYFHNMIGLLTEAIGNPTPMEIPFLPTRQLAKGDLPYPIAPQKWHFRQSIDYSITANRAVLDLASKHREDFLFNIYRMGKNSIERGSRDCWTITPKRIAEVQAAIAKDAPQGGPAGGPEGRDRRAAGVASDAAPADSPLALAGVLARGVSLKYYDMLRAPDKRDPRGYIIPSDQADFLTATKFVNTLIKTGITIHRATSAFQVAGKTYPAGSYVVKTAQAFRPHVLDMFEPQDHPDDIPYPGGPPTPPYDNAGYTLAFQMGVAFDRILDGFDGPFEKIHGLVKPAPGNINTVANAVGFLLDHRVNDSIIAVNRLLSSGEDVYWLKQSLNANGKAFGPGAIFIPSKPSTLPKLQKLAAEIGLSFDAVASKPTGEAYKLRPLRIGLWDRYGGSMPSGWVRWLLEQYEFGFTVVYPPTLDAGGLAGKFDVLIFVDGGIPARDARPGQAGGGGGGFGAMPEPESIPAEFRERLGNVTVARTIPQLRQFLEAGGTMLTIGSSNSFAYNAGLPIANALMEKQPDGVERALPREKFYVPGSILQVRVDNTNPLAYGMSEKLDVFFDNSPVFRMKPEASIKGVKPVAWFDSDKPLRSGWAWGQKYLQDGVAVAEASVGKGKLFLFGPEITFRAQPHGTFKYLFNGVYYGGAELVSFR